MVVTFEPGTLNPEPISLGLKMTRVIFFYRQPLLIRLAAFCTGLNPNRIFNVIERSYLN